MVDTPETIRGGGVVCIEALHSLLDKSFKRPSTSGKKGSSISSSCQRKEAIQIVRIGKESLS